MKGPALGPQLSAFDHRSLTAISRLPPPFSVEQAARSIRMDTLETLYLLKRFRRDGLVALTDQGWQVLLPRRIPPIVPGADPGRLSGGECRRLEILAFLDLHPGRDSRQIAQALGEVVTLMTKRLCNLRHSGFVVGDGHAARHKGWEWRLTDAGRQECGRLQGKAGVT